MNIYVIYAILHNGIVDKYSPMGIRTDKNEIFKVAKQLKKDVKTYKRVYVVCSVYQKLDAFILEVE